MRLRPLVATLAICSCLHATVLVPPSRAEDPAPDCANALSTADMNTCAARDLEKADTELNRVYQEALKSIPDLATDDPNFNAATWEKALRASQRAWVTFRDAECNEHVSMFSTGGSIGTVEALSCAQEKTEERTKELKERYEIE
ncbi:MAG: lysozyme inhibitor LprI family protein [Hyphomicrobium sp.]|nr:lysozyme inhibitor LprI family protein [Hyphomicrobium sp.]